jgi:CubicO group peptidase (beta-lactamase class C family)
MRRCRLLALLLALGGNVLARETAWPTVGWKTATPAEQGIDGGALEALSAELAGKAHGYIDGMLVIRHGAIVFQRTYRRDYEAAFLRAPDQSRGMYNYYDPDWHPFYRGTDLHTLQSVSKSVTATLLGIAIRRGAVKGVDLPVLPFLAGYRIAADPRRSRWTLRHLLTMTAGNAWDETSTGYSDPKNSSAAMERSGDWIQFVLDQPMAEEPGRRFVYNSGATQLLAQVLRQATGRQADDYAAEELFKPLGITRHYWKRTPTGHPDTEGGLYLAATDVAKIGYLYLHDGQWEGRRILPEGWVKEATAAHVEVPGRPERRYGYQWWKIVGGDRPDNIFGNGYGGQYLMVLPSLDLIAVFTGWNIYDQPPLNAGMALDRLVAAVKRP